MDKDLAELLATQAARAEKSKRRRSFLIVPFTARIREMMENNISLPLINEWLGKKEVAGVHPVVTLQTLRNFVVRELGEAFYADYCNRNGWAKSTQQRAEKRNTAKPGNLKNTTSVTTAEKKLSTDLSPEEVLRRTPVSLRPGESETPTDILDDLRRLSREGDK